MIAGLLWKDRNEQWLSKADSIWEDRFLDLKLEPIVHVMSGGDPCITEVCRQVLDAPLQTAEEIQYRQEILKDCLRDSRTIETVYEICSEAERKRKSTWCRLTSPHLTTVYSSAQDLLKIYLEALVAIRKSLEKAEFHSQGLQQLSKLLTTELSDAYLEQLRELQPGIASKNGIEISAGFGPYLQGVSYVKRQPDQKRARLRWLLQPSYTLGDRDMKGAKDLELREDRAIHEVANVMAQAAESLQSLVDQLRKELSFYLGGIHLWETLKAGPKRLCFPELTDGNNRSYTGLYDGTLVLAGHENIVPNTLQSVDHRLWLITGANQGGKTTFLRSIGLCQLMAQCGLFVFAEACRIPVRQQIFTHFVREEDRSLSSGKLEEELCRMDAIVERIQPNAMLLSNESFSSTNDRDGSEIFLGIVRGLLSGGIEIFAVTHLIEFADTIARRQDVLSLRPGRTETGERTYQLQEAKPIPDAYAEDIYREIFGADEGPKTSAKTGRKPQ